MNTVSRRSFLRSTLAAPAIVAASSLMPVSARALIMPAPLTIYVGDWFTLPMGTGNTRVCHSFSRALELCRPYRGDTIVILPNYMTDPTTVRT